MKTCEEFEVLASAFVDDELSRDETVSLLDHLAVCEGCRFFYRQARSLDEALTGSPAVQVLPERAWKRIESQVRRRPVTQAWGLKAAAGFVLAFLVWQVAQIRSAPTPTVKDVRPIEISLEGAKNEMNDSRFIEITSEILRADRRYHAAMLQVMTEVNEATGVERVSEESTSSEGDRGERAVEKVQREVKS